MRQSTMLLAIFALVTVFNVANASGDCYLRQNTTTAIDPAMTLADQKGSKAATKPFPSLTQCYKYNTEACCVSGHDQQIQSHFSGLLSSTCLREFPDLEVYMCFGCHPQQPKYVDLAAKKIRVCKSFADRLFTTKPSKYDACGLAYGNNKYILPSFHFKTATKFLNTYKPPLFSDFEIVVQEEENDECFKSAAGKMVISALTFIGTVLFTIAML